MTKTSTPKPLRQHLQAPMNGLLSSVNSIIEAMRGETGLSAPKDRAKAASIEESISIKKAPQGPLADVVVNELIPVVEKLAALYNQLGDFTLERAVGAVGAERSLRGKLVHAAANTPAPFRERFGAEGRKVEDESVDENGVKLVKIEGLSAPVPHSYVVQHREKAAS